MIMEIDFITSNKGKIAALKRSFLNAGRFDIKVNQFRLISLNLSLIISLMFQNIKLWKLLKY